MKSKFSASYGSISAAAPVIFHHVIKISITVEVVCGASETDLILLVT